MKRKAILIGSNRAVPGEPLRGVDADKAAITSFLKSAPGGAWYDGEIATLAAPTKADLIIQLGFLTNGIDFALVFFAGHGGHAGSATKICLNAKENVDVEDLRTFAPKNLIVVDACRTLLVEFAEPEGIEKLAKALPSPGYVASCRRLYDRQIEAAEVGTSFYLACSNDEAADETPEGGVFTRSLIRTSCNWAANAGNNRDASAILTAGASHARVLADFARRRIAQHPDYWAGRRHYHFPIAVA